MSLFDKIQQSPYEQQARNALEQLKINIPPEIMNDPYAIARYMIQNGIAKGPMAQRIGSMLGQK